MRLLLATVGLLTALSGPALASQPFPGYDAQHRQDWTQHGDEMFAWENLMEFTGAAQACGILTDSQVLTIIDHTTPAWVKNQPLVSAAVAFYDMAQARQRGAERALNAPVLCEQLLTTQAYLINNLLKLSNPSPGDLP
jgi:hypothetical protein